MCGDVTVLEDGNPETKEALGDMLYRHGDETDQAHGPLISRLSPEVISSIFTFCVPITLAEANSQSEDFCDSTPQWSTPWLLGSVCRYWKDITWSSPRLWTVIRIKLEWRKLYFRSWEEIMRGWFDRSGQLPLYIYVTAASYDRDPRKSPLYLSPLIDIINKYSMRWYELHLCVEASLFSFFDVDCPMLHTLKLTLFNDSQDNQITLQGASPIQLCLTRTRLKSVQIVWNNITRAEFDHPQVGECLHFLKHAGQLAHLKLWDICEVTEDDFPIPSSPILHRNLVTMKTVLNVSLNSVTAAWNILLNSITLPKLQRLHIHQKDLPTDLLLHFVERSSCSLKDLHLEGLRNNEGDIDTLLESMPSLQCLKLEWDRLYDPSPDNLFRRLAQTSLLIPTDSVVQFLPNLKSFRYLSGKVISWQLLADAFGPLSQLNNFHRRLLEEVHIEFESEIYNLDITAFYMTANESHRISQLLDNGLVIEVGYKDPYKYRIFDLDIRDFMSESANHYRNSSGRT